MTIPEPFLTNRSTILAGQDCPRMLWLEYYWGGTGIVRKSQAVPLATGIYTHEGVGKALQGSGEDESAGYAASLYSEEVQRRGLEDDADGYVAREQTALAEALVRLHHRECLPSLREHYEVIAVERDDCRELAPGIGWQFRVDATLRGRLTGGLTAYSLKTKSQWGKLSGYEVESDMQGLSEAWGLEQALGEEVEAVKMDFLMKGPRRESGARREQMCHLVRAWRSDDVPIRYAWRWDWEDAEGKHRLSAKKWKPFHVWEAMGVKEWMDMLWSGEIQPEAGHPRQGLLVSYPPIFRDPRHIGRWKRQTIAQVERLREALGRVSDPIATGSEELDVWFPQFTRRCTNFQRKCSYCSICHEGGRVAIDPLGSGEFIRREPHHTSGLDGGDEEE